MGNSEYHWEPGGVPPLIKDHSLAKHEVLGRYLRTYVEVLTANPVIDSFRLSLIDGFAGGGCYLTERGELHPGSPLQMIHAVRDAEAVANARRKKEFLLDAEFYFVEKQRRNLEVLHSSLQHDATAVTYQRQGRVRILQGSFEQRASEILEDVAARSNTRRAIFLLDQYGYTHVPLDTLRRILSRLPRAEILLTFATDWLIDYMSAEGVINSSRLEKMGLLDMASQFEELATCKEHREPRWRRLVQSVLYRDLVQRSGARYFTPFFILSPGAHREYWFVHLSRHARARDEMAKLHWLIQNRFAHYGRHGLGMLGYDPREDATINIQQVFDFSEDSNAELMRLLEEQLPRRLSLLDESVIEFSDFFDVICNETPATSEQIREALRRLSVEREVEIYSPENRRRGAGVQIRNHDRIGLPPQLSLFMGKK